METGVAVSTEIMGPAVSMSGLVEAGGSLVLQGGRRSGQLLQATVRGPVGKLGQPSSYTHPF
jgi:hypothetical protein